MVLYHHYLCKGNVKINEENLDAMEVPLFYGPIVSWGVHHSTLFGVIPGVPLMSQGKKNQVSFCTW